MTRIAIFTADERTWSFELWKRTIPELKRGATVVGLYVFPDRLGTLQGARIPLWYFRVFGCGNFIIFSFYSFMVRVKRIRSPVRSWVDLVRVHGLELHRAKTPNASEVVEWVKKNDIDVIFITVSHVLKSEILATPRIGIINKHASVLPAGKGFFPFLWTKSEGVPAGVTFHRVNERIDEGDILVQKEYSQDQSMLRFYVHVFRDFPTLALQALDRLIRREYQEIRPEIPHGYHSLPTREMVRRSGVEISRWGDVWYALRCNQLES